MKSYGIKEASVRITNKNGDSIFVPMREATLITSCNDELYARPSKLSKSITASGTFKFAKYGYDMMTKGWSFRMCKLTYKKKTVKSVRLRKKYRKLIANLDS